jgi:hypothetical protein
MNEKNIIIESVEKYENRIKILEELVLQYSSFCEEIMDIKTLNNENLGLDINKIQRKALAQKQTANKYLKYPTVKTRKCLYCGKDISHKDYKAKFCSNKGEGNCKDAYHNENNPRGYGLNVEDEYMPADFCEQWGQDAFSVTGGNQ